MITAYAKDKIPLEAIWISKENLDETKSADIKEAFGDISDLAKSIHDNSQKILVTLEPGLSSSDDFFTDALRSEALVESTISSTGTKFKNALVTNGFREQTVFLDLLNEEGVRIQGTLLDHLYEQVPFDGLWLSDNQIFTFCDGECLKEEKKATSKSVEAQCFVDSNQWYKSYSN